MPAYRKPEYKGPGSSLLKAYQGWKEQEPSVMDAAWEAPAKKLANVADFFIPSETDVATTNFAPGLGSVGVPLISIFKNKAARMAGTEAFRKKAKELMSFLIEEYGAEGLAKNIDTATEEFARRYPRIAAHTDLKPAIFPGTTYRGAVLNEPGKVVRPVPTEFGSASIGHRRPEDLDKVMTTMFHEGTHVAQALGNSKFNELYNKANQLGKEAISKDRIPFAAADAYLDNPFEITARASGHRGYDDWARKRSGYYPFEYKKKNAITEFKKKFGMEEYNKIRNPTNEPLKESVTKAFSKVEPEETEIQKILRQSQGNRIEPDYKDFDFQKWFTRENKRKLEEEARNLKK
jgi:hypothetical protein